MKSTLNWVALLALITVLFYWKVLLTGQFSLLTEAEGVNQGYAWLQFWISSIRQMSFPLWDPYIFSGRSFAGEMQTSAFYPLNLVLLLVPFNQNGVLSPQLYHGFIVLVHFLAACFMFALVRELGASRYAAIISGICFSMGGFVGGVPWPHLLGSSIWLPVIFLFLLRAMKTESLRSALVNAGLSGLIWGISILAGGLHIAIMQAMVIFSAVAFHGFHQQSERTTPASKERIWIRAAAVIAVAGVIGLSAGAVQLLPSVEYSRHAVRFFGDVMLPATQKIPYAYLRDGVSPQGLWMFPMFQAFNGNVGAGEVLNPYIGVFPLLLAIIGVWKNWGNFWVRYLTVLAASAFLYSLGSYSLLHGLLYALVPFLWMAREAGRFLYLADFALAILAAFGTDTLFSEGTDGSTWSRLNRILKWVAIGCAVALSIPAVFGKPEIHPWNAFSILLIVALCGLFYYVARHPASRPGRALVIALILFDLEAFDWTARNKLDVAKSGADHLERLLSCRPAAAFLKTLRGPFRVQVLAGNAPNIGDAFGIQTTGGATVTMPANYKQFVDKTPHAYDLLNVRYFLKPAAAPEPGAIYQDAFWKVYENPQAYPPAWLVHETMVEPSREKLLDRLAAPGTDTHRAALVSAALDAALEPPRGSMPEDVTFQRYEAGTLQLTAHANSRALLVLSEVFYPGWQASVNGRPARIYEVDGALRGIVIEAGENQVTLRYVPGSVLAGGLLSGCAFLGMLAFLLVSRQARARGFYTENPPVREN